MKNSFFLALAFLLVFWSSCERKAPEEVVVEEKRNPYPEFNADSAYAFIQQQVDFGPRVPNTEPHRRTAEWLTGKFQSFGLEVQTQEFTATAHDGTQLELTNIIASYNPTATKRILLAAHWDTRRVADKDTEDIYEPIDGANDGGSGVGILLEIARVIGSGELQPDVGVDFVLFDGEDDGEPDFKQRRDTSKIWWCLGSQYWSNNLHAPGYSAYFGILLDMVGAKNARFYKEGYSREYAKNILDMVWQYGHELGHSDFFQMRQAESITDDHLFVNQNANIPMINIIDFHPDHGFGHYHHTHADNMDLIDRKTLQVVGETVLFTIFQQ